MAGGKARLPPRWFIGLLGHLHRWIVRVSGGRRGRGLRARGSMAPCGSPRPAQRRAAERDRRLLRGWAQPGHDGHERLGCGRAGLVAEPAAHPEAVVELAGGIRREVLGRLRWAGSVSGCGGAGELDQNSTEGARRPRAAAVVVLEQRGGDRMNQPSPRRNLSRAEARSDGDDHLAAGAPGREVLDGVSGTRAGICATPFPNRSAAAGAAGRGRPLSKSFKDMSKALNAQRGDPQLTIQSLGDGPPRQASPTTQPPAPTLRATAEGKTNREIRCSAWSAAVARQLYRLSRPNQHLTQHRASSRPLYSVTQSACEPCGLITSLRR